MRGYLRSLIRFCLDAAGSALEDLTEDGRIRQSVAGRSELAGYGDGSVEFWKVVPVSRVGR